MAEAPYRNGHDTVDWRTGEVPSALARIRAGRFEPHDPRAPQTSSSGLTIVVNEDGSVDQINLPNPAYHRGRDNSKSFEANLAENLGDNVLTGVAQDYLDGVAADIMSRSGFIANYNRGIDLLGLKIEEASSSRGNRQSLSRTKNPALLKACVRSQSLARGQLLPADGPVRIATIGGSDTAQDELARRMEADFNYYLVDVAKEYYPDTDRALFYRAYGGSMYKKVFGCPLRRRPVSESVQLENLIVSEDATDLANALRKTNEIVMSPVTMRKMQLMGGWIDTPLAVPQMNDNPARRKTLESMGIAAISARSQDTSFTVYEGYTSLDPRMYGIDEPGAPEGIPLPYRVIIERDSHKVLALYRNWKPKDEEFRERQTFVKYGLIPGLGFLDYGYLHLIGNQTRVLTAIWQILVDKGMLANFPAGMKVKGVRTDTNEINPALGEWVEVSIGNMASIKDALMAMPYGDIGPAFVEFAKMIEDDVEKLSGTIEIEMGGNRQNMPVGTLLAMIEQQTTDLTAVHQRDHRAQKEELCLLRDLFAEKPEYLRWLSRKGGTDWMEKLAEFSDMELSPASDPNVPSQTHRIMLNMFLMQMAQQAPQLFGSKLRTVALRILTSAGINDADSLLASQQEIDQALQQAKGAQGVPPGQGAGQAATQKAQMELPLKQAELQLKQQQVQGEMAIEAGRLQLDQQESQREAANEAAQHEQRQQQMENDAALSAAEIAHKRDQLAADSQPEAPEQLSALDLANLRKIDAQAFGAMGTGAQGFAKARQTVQQGEQELSDIDQTLAGKGGKDGGRLQRPSRRRRQATTEGDE